MVNSRSKTSLEVAKRLFAGLTLVVGISVLAACGSNEDSVTNLTSGKSTLQNATPVEESTKTPLLASLNALYPDGQAPSDQSEAAAVKRMQSANNNISTATSVGSAAGSSALSSALLGIAKDQDADSIKAQSAASAPIRPQAGAIYSVISRVQNTSLYGAYFFTIYPTERSAALAGNPKWNYEGPAFSASLVPDVDLFPVHRFRNLQNGSYLYTIYEAERNTIATTLQSTFAYEGVAWYARQTAAEDWKPLYRFRNKNNGTYLFSAYEDEKNAIVANYSAVFELEGVAYFVRNPDVVDKYVGTWDICAASGTTPAYIKLRFAYEKISSTSLFANVTAPAGYSDSQCKNQTQTGNGTVVDQVYATYTGTKVVAGKTVDKMYSTTKNVGVFKDVYYTTGNLLYLGASGSDAEEYYTSLNTIPLNLR